MRGQIITRVSIVKHVVSKGLCGKPCLIQLISGKQPLLFPCPPPLDIALPDDHHSNGPIITRTEPKAMYETCGRPIIFNTRWFHCSQTRLDYVDASQIAEARTSSFTPQTEQKWRRQPATDTEDIEEGEISSWHGKLLPSHEATQFSHPFKDHYIPVNALYIARSLDLKGLLSGPFQNYRSHFVRNNVVIRFPDRSNGPASSNEGSQNPDNNPALNERYMVSFNYGSVVFLNFEGEEQEVVLDMMLPYCTDHFREVRKDDYGVVVRPSLAGWSEGGQDHVLVKQLDINNIRVIASVLGQSVALEFYAKKVDEMVNTFSELNRGMEQTGTFTMKRKKLFQLVAAANTTLADVILRLGLLERSDTAWKHAQYTKIWEYLRDDFELDERFESLDFKLNIIQHNVRFFLDILQNRKSDTLEWIIILLIAGEICVSLYEIISKAMETSAGA